MNKERMSRWLSGVTFSMACLPLSAATLTVDSDGGTYTTIQSAVDAAVAGDIIRIKPHHDSRGYRENVVIDTPDLTLRGSGSASASTYGQRCPKVVLDGCETPAASTECNDTVIQINVPDVRIQSLTIRHGRLDLDTAHRTLIEKICVIDPINSNTVRTEIDTDTDIDIDSHDVIVRKSVFQGGSSDSIDLAGDNIQVLNNRLLVVDDGIEISGDNFLVKGNRMVACNDACIEVDGNNGRVERNILDGGDDGIEYDGDQPTIILNRIDNMSDDAIRVDCEGGCTGGTIARNRITGSVDEEDGIRVTSENNTVVNFLIERNVIYNSAGSAIDFFGNDSTIQNNRISRAGTESGNVDSCLRIEGDGNTVQNNRLNFCSFQGIRHFDGSTNQFLKNRIIGSGRAGIQVQGGSDNLVAGNIIVRSHGEGIANTGGTDTDIENNLIVKSRTDICNDASVDVFDGNIFATGGDAEPCVVDE